MGHQNINWQLDATCIFSHGVHGDEQKISMKNLAPRHVNLLESVESSDQATTIRFVQEERTLQSDRPHDLNSSGQVPFISMHAKTENVVVKCCESQGRAAPQRIHT